CLQTNNFPWTF
nr:immunoglobulin light chain junction region [Macaca mulatta]